MRPPRDGAVDVRKVQVIAPKGLSASCSPAVCAQRPLSPDSEPLSLRHPPLVCPSWEAMARLDPAARCLPPAADLPKASSRNGATCAATAGLEFAPSKWQAASAGLAGRKLQLLKDRVEVDVGYTYQRRWYQEAEDGQEEAGRAHGPIVYGNTARLQRKGNCKHVIVPKAAPRYHLRPSFLLLSQDAGKLHLPGAQPITTFAGKPCRASAVRSLVRLWQPRPLALRIRLVTVCCLTPVS